MREKLDSAITNGNEIEVLDEIEMAYSPVRRPARLPSKIIVSIGEERYLFTNQTSISRFYNRITQSNSDVTLKNALHLADMFIYDDFQGRELCKLSPLRMKKAKTHEGTEYAIFSKYSEASNFPLYSYVKINNETK